MGVYRRILTSIPRWWTRIPDPSTFVGLPSIGHENALPNGRGSSAATQRVPAAAARSADGDWILAYLAGRTTLTIHMDKITAGNKAEAFWIDPKTGDRILIGGYPTTGQQSFTTPAGWEDAVLLVAKPGIAAARENQWHARRGPRDPGRGCSAATRPE
jgi:hypothetical protein